MRKDKDDYPDRSATIDVAPHNVNLQSDGEAIRADAKEVERKRMLAWLSERVAGGKCAEVITLTPVLAQLLLDHNPVNRKIAKQNAADLRNDISEGRYEYNGESISVSKTLKLLNGQHRCMQVVATGISVETVIAFGAEDKARFTIDIGKPKSVSDFLGMKERLYSSILGAATNYHLQWRLAGAIVYGGGNNRPTKTMIVAAADELKGIDASVEFTVRSMKTVRAHAVLAFCHYVFWKRSSRESADHFIGKLIDGNDLRKGDPILYCRNRLQEMKRGITAGQRAELIFKCWNAHRRGTAVDHCKITGGKLPKVER